MNCTVWPVPTSNDPQCSTLLLPAVTTVLFAAVAIVAEPATTEPAVGSCACNPEAATATTTAKPRPAHRGIRGANRGGTEAR